jgi:hypothetical protein
MLTSCIIMIGLYQSAAISACQDASCQAAAPEEVSVELLQQTLDLQRKGPEELPGVQVPASAADLKPTPQERAAVPVEVETMTALMKSLHKGEIKGISVEAVVPLATKIMGATTEASKQEVVALVKSLDKNHDGKFNIEELPPAVRSTDEDDSGAVQAQPSSPASGEALVQTNSTGSWQYTTMAGGWPVSKYSESRWFQPKVNMPNVDSPDGCLVHTYVFYAHYACDDYYRYFYTNGNLCRCYPKLDNLADFDWTWYYSSSGNYIYYSQQAPVFR